MKRKLWLLAAASLVSGMQGQAEDLWQMPQIVVTATKTAEDQHRVPQSSEVITAEEMKQRGAYNLKTGLETALNLNMTNNVRGGSLVSLRGMNTDHVLILENGQRMAEEDSIGLQNVNVLDRISLSDVDRVEIVRTSSSALYGSDALGGVINIITKMPEKAGMEAGVSAGTDHVSQYLRLSSGRHGRWASSVNFQLTKVRQTDVMQSEETFGSSYRGYILGNSSNFYGMKRYLSGEAVYDFQNKNHNQLRFQGSYTEENLRTNFPDEYRTMTYNASPDADSLKHPAQFSGFFSKDKQQRFNNRSWQTGVDYTGETGRNSYLFRMYYSRLKKNFSLFNGREGDLPVSYIPTQGPYAPPADWTKVDYNQMNPTSDFDRSRYDLWSAEARDTWKAGHHQITAGSEMIRNSLKGTRLGGSGSDSAYEDGLSKPQGEKSLQSEALYLQDEWQVTPKLFVVPALRWEHNSRFGEETVPKIGLTYAFDSHTRMKINYGKSYKAPTLSDLYFRFDHFGMFMIYGNPNLKPETSLGGDISLEAERGRTFSSLTWFDSRVSNLIFYASIPSDKTVPDQQFVNIGRARIKGIEAAAGHRIGQSWTVKVAYTWLQARDEDTGHRLTDRPRQTVTTQLIYDDGAPAGWSGDLWCQWTGQYRYAGASDENSGSASGVSRDYTWSTWNLTVRKKWHRDLSAYAGIRNILNRKTDHGGTDDLYIDGRMWTAGMDVSF